MIRLKLIWGWMIVLGCLIFFYSPVLAHGHTQVGDYELVIGFHNEPPYQGEPNSLDLFVTNTKTGERVNGLEETLQAEIRYGGSSKSLKLEPQFGQEGAYTAHVLPTETGDYTWRIFGAIQDTPVDVSMTSSPETFGSVEPKSSISFPGAEPEGDQAAGQAITIALWTGIAGAILGVLGMIMGYLGWQAARRAAP